MLYNLVGIGVGRRMALFSIGKLQKAIVENNAIYMPTAMPIVNDNQPLLSLTFDSKNDSLLVSVYQIQTHVTLSKFK